jgi:hypothetical protein
VEKSVWICHIVAVSLCIEKNTQNTRKDKMNLPLPNRDNRSLSMREQVIARLRQLNPDVVYRQAYLDTLQDHALLQALEVAIMCHMDREHESQSSYMFNAGMDYERERIVKSLTETHRMKAGEFNQVASWE